MKTKAFYFTAIIALMSLSSVFGQTTKTEEFKVSGNCGMCEKRIEKAANSVEGVSEADWDKKTKMIKVAIDTSKTDVHKIHMEKGKHPGIEKYRRNQDYKNYYE